jgi:hypothetical protein
MNMATKINRPRRICVKYKNETPQGAVFIGPKSKWWPKQVNTGGTPAYARETYRQSLTAPRKWRTRIEICNELRGKDIASKCPADQPSFVDVLLDIANSGEVA